MALPARYRGPVALIYRFAREADDIADEGEANAETRLRELQHYGDSLRDIEAQRPPAIAWFSELGAVIRTHRLPFEPFHDLLSAFSQDVTRTRYARYEEVLDYCRRSANPVGRLLLALYGADNAANRRWSDAICTGLQLVNFLQDIAVDYQKGRIYLALDELADAGLTPDDIARGRNDARWEGFMKQQVARTRALLVSGTPLGRVMRGRLGFEMRMIISGGARILDKIDAVHGDVFRARPVLKWHDWPPLVTRALRTDMNPHEYCQQKAAQSGSSFYYSFLFLPEDRRRAITALYAFCREVDDVVDEVTEPTVARAKLGWWSQEIERVYRGGAQHPVALALADIVKPFGLEEDRLHEIIAGMFMDLDHQRYATYEGLKHYCHHVAGVVGVLSAKIFGYQNPLTLEYAEDLGLAFQLTNIIRDVGEDARRNRIYLPLDELTRFGVTETDILGARETDGFKRLMAFQIDRALRLYDSAFAKLSREDRKAQRPGIVMAAIYRTLLKEIADGGCRVLTQRTALTPVRKLWIAWRTWIRG
jgi:phytoene synthase